MSIQLSTDDTNAPARAEFLPVGLPVRTIPARTLCISGGTLKKRTALSLKLPPVVRAQVEFEATARILSGDNATFMLHLRVGAACFAALDVLSVGAYVATRASAELRPLLAFARARAPRGVCLAQSASWTGHVHTYGCVITFSARARANVGSPVGVVPDLRATHRPVPTA